MQSDTTTPASPLTPTAASGSTAAGGPNATTQRPPFASILPNAELVQLLQRQNLEFAMPLQVKALAALLAGHDVIITGGSQSGKTMSHAIHLAALRADGAPTSRSLIVASSQALINQLKEKLASFGARLSILGQGTIGDASVIVGTIGDTLQALRDKLIDPQSLRVVVLDEVSEPLSAATIADFEALLTIIRADAASAQLVMVSRSMSFAISGLTKKFLKSPVEVSAAAEDQRQVEVSHVYAEVGTDLLAKPSALADIVEATEPATVVVFCNSPSDADFVEVMLKKRGVGTRKLIGNAPPFKVTSALREIKGGECRTLVVTDVAARTIEIEQFDISVNYSMPDDPEVYLHRLGTSGRAGRQGKVISLIGPLDVTNFHYLRKFVDFKFSQEQLPDRQKLSQTQISKLERQAQQTPAAKESRIQEVVKTILESPERDTLLGFLVYNTLDVMPRLSSVSQSESRGRSGDEYGDQEEDEGRDDRGGRFGRGSGRGGDDRRRGRGGRDRNGPGRRYDEDQPRSEGEGSYESRSRDESGGDGRSSFRDRRDGYRDRPQRDSRDGDSRERDFRDRNPRDRGERDSGDRRGRGPSPKLARVYLGHGEKDGFSEGELKTLLSGEKSDLLKRFNLRGSYSFADFPDERVEEVIGFLKEQDRSAGGKVFITRATLIPEPRPSGGRDQQDDDYGFQGGGDEGGSDRRRNADDARPGEREGRGSRREEPAREERPRDGEAGEEMQESFGEREPMRFTDEE